MPKRSHEESKEERWQRKMKKYEAKLHKKKLIVHNDVEEERIEESHEPELDDGWYPYPSDEDVSVAPTTAAGYDLEHVVTVANPSTELDVQAESSATAGATAATILEIDPEFLEALGNLDEETSEWGEPIIEQVAMRLKPVLLNGNKKEDRETLLKKYPFPKNLTLAKAPTLNAEISAMLSETSRNRDKRLYAKQNQLGAILSGVTKAMSQLMCKEPKIVDILSILSDASKLLADSHYLETDTRKSLIIPLIDKELIDSFKDRKRDEFLFGDKLGDLVKNSRGIKKTGQLIQATPPVNLNSRGPSSRGRPHKHYLNRGGGQQRPYRRRATPYPPTTAAPARRHNYAQPAPRHRPPATASSAPRSTTAAATDRTMGTHP